MSAPKPQVPAFRGDGLTAYGVAMTTALGDAGTPGPAAYAEHGVLALAGRGDLPFASLHRVPLYLHALRALVDASSEDVVLVVGADDRPRVRDEVARTGLSVRVLTEATWWAHLRRERPGSLLVHDSLCPLASAEFLASVRRGSAMHPEVSRVAFRPVTDTVKTVVDERIQGTIDREGLAALISPCLVASTVLAAAVAADDEPPLHDFAELVGWLRQRGPVELVKGPSLARRVDDASAVNLLECVDEIARRVRIEPGIPGQANELTAESGPGTP